METYVKNVRDGAEIFRRLRKHEVLYALVVTVALARERAGVAALAALLAPAGSIAGAEASA